jgi:hypothetical protein
VRATRWSAAAAPLVLIILLPAGSLASAAAIPTSTCTPGTVPGFLLGVAASSSSDAWAAGIASTSTSVHTLIEHWNGTAWCTVATPNPGGSSGTNQLEGVAAVSSSSAWAVGSYGTSTQSHTLIAHWNGTAWSQQASPNPAGFAFGSQLAGVAATSLSSAWAVGESVKDVGPSTSQTLIARWNGTAWAQASSPNPGGTGSGSANFLFSVTATSSSNAWAVGGYATSPTANGHTLVVHWNGTAWQQQPSP